MEEETKQKVEETVMEILKNTDMAAMTEFKVRNMAAEKLGLDLSVSDSKQFVRNVVESFLLSMDEAQITPPPLPAEETREAVEAETTKKSTTERKFDDDGHLLICRLSNKRKVTIQDFRGKTLVSLREYYGKDGKQIPSYKGISLTIEQWSAFRNAVPAIEEAIKKMASRLK